jgi:DNA-binding response OmpR family regulator
MSPWSRLRILVTEDEPDTRALLEIMLRIAGHEVISTDNSKEALQLAQTNSIDLYLLDNWMAGVSGIDLCRQLREFDGKTPVLFYSGAAYESDKTAALAAGAQGYLVKPCEPEKMLAEIGRLTSNRARYDTGQL